MPAVVACACEILEPDAKLKNVVNVRVPGVYGTKGVPLPKRMALIVLPAAQALIKVFEEVAAEGGHLYISDMFRSATQQQQAHEDWKLGKKTAFSPPSCSSVHEAGRAIDIDAFDTGIGHKRVRQILNKHGWVNIVDTLTGPECWHYEFREERWETYKKANGYAAMAHAMKVEIGNLVGAAKAEKKREEVRWLQEAMNTLLGTQLALTGTYDEKLREAVRDFQSRHGLQADGIAGPITTAKVKELLAA